MTGRLVKWAIELREYEITFEPRGPIKAQVLLDFVVKLTLPSTNDDEELGPKDIITMKWLLSVDVVVLERLGGILVEQSMKFSFKTSNNQINMKP